MLKDIPVSQVQKMIAEIPVLDELINFLNKNRERCFIVTSNLDVWIIELMKKIGMENNFRCSNAIVEDDRITSISHILSKAEATKSFDCPIIAVGDGNNDAEMLEVANIGIGFGAVRPIAPSVLKVADYAVYSEKKLVELLNRFL